MFVATKAVLEPSKALLGPQPLEIIRKGAWNASRKGREYSGDFAGMKGVKKFLKRLTRFSPRI